MVNKCEKMFSIFDRNIVLSSNVYINAITPYDVIHRSNVIGVDDIIENLGRNYFKQSTISVNTVYSFCNPATEEYWYLGRYLIAYQNKKKMNFPGLSCPKIVLLFCNNKVIADEDYGELYFKFRKFLFNDYYNKTTKSVIFVSNIGMLCYPDRPLINRLEVKELKLPLVI